MSGAAAGSGRKVRDGDKKGASDAQYALETGMKAEFTRAAQDLGSNVQISFAAAAKKAKEQVKLFLQNATDYGPALGASAGDSPATVEKLRRAFKGSHASMLSICCSVRQGTEVHAHLKDVGTKPLSLQGKTLGDLLVFKRMSTASKEVVKDAEDSMPYFKELKKLMGERKAGEEEDEVELAEPKDLKTRITCPVSMAIMKEPVKKCVPKACPGPPPPAPPACLHARAHTHAHALHPPPPQPCLRPHL